MLSSGVHFCNPLSLTDMPKADWSIAQPTLLPGSPSHRHQMTLSGALQDKSRRTAWERTLVQFQCRMFVASWTGVVRYHGPRPVNRPNNVWVCNHTSMIDYIILTSYSPFAVIMQLHAGWIAFLQTRVLSCLGCLWFNRNEVPPNSLSSLCLTNLLSICTSNSDLFSLFAKTGPQRLGGACSI